MKKPMSEARGRQLDAIFLLLLLCTDGYEDSDSQKIKEDQNTNNEKEFYFNEKLLEYEINKYRY